MSIPKSFAWITPGALVWYWPIMGHAPGYAGVVDGEPWQLGGQTWVVNLRDMSPEYRAKVRDRSRVNAAFLGALQPRDAEEPTT